jgi:signal transduction histidine kinase
VAIALGTWALACGLLLVAPLFEAVDPELSLAMPQSGTSSWWLTVVAISLQAVALLWARRAPRVVLLAVCVVTLLTSSVVGGAAFSLTRPAVVVAVFLTSLLLPLRDCRSVAAVAALVVAGGEVVNALHASHSGILGALGQALLQTVAIVIAPLLLGSVFAAQRQAREAHRAELRALAGERDALVSAAVAQERTAMARELHDIAAHHLSGIAVMAAAVDRQIDSDPEAARQSVRQVRAQSRAVLDDLRRLVGLLREDDGDERSVRTLASAVDLVRDRAMAGMPVELHTLTAESERPLGDGVGPLAQLVAYRMVQESLTNAATHAPGARCRVEIDDRKAGTLTVTVTNDPAPDTAAHAGTSPKGGFGLVGMRERAGLIAATMRSGTTVEGGWAVALTIPRDHPTGAVPSGLMDAGFPG